ncbi:unnamed protein product [Rodentolepis nana]|uniref:General transcription factor 3C polypeptide 2 n=1 Tax=Rodentolepis nana TaxID=102285 RepID=A0A0R3TEK9_RODNA|nr:unnamed protein product [Rodentolepis nana]
MSSDEIRRLGQCIAQCQKVNEFYNEGELDIKLVKSIVDGQPKFDAEQEEKPEGIQENEHSLEQPQECTGEVEHTEVNEMTCSPKASSVHESCADAQDAVEHVENEEPLPTDSLEQPQECTGEVEHTEVNEMSCSPKASSVHEICAYAQGNIVIYQLCS